MVDVLVAKCESAMRKTGLKRLCVGGGVAANTRFRERLEESMLKLNCELHIAPLALCTDNAVMGAIAVERWKAGLTEELSLTDRRHSVPYSAGSDMIAAITPPTTPNALSVGATHRRKVTEEAQYISDCVIPREEVCPRSRFPVRSVPTANQGSRYVFPPSFRFVVGHVFLHRFRLLGANAIANDKG